MNSFSLLEIWISFSCSSLNLGFLTESAWDYDLDQRWTTYFADLMQLEPIWNIFTELQMQFLCFWNWFYSFAMSSPFFCVVIAVDYYLHYFYLESIVNYYLFYLCFGFSVDFIDFFSVQLRNWLRMDRRCRSGRVDRINTALCPPYSTYTKWGWSYAGRHKRR